MSKQPKLMNYSRMKEILNPHIAQIRKHSFINNELGMIYRDPTPFLFILQQSQPPFTIDDYRIGIFVRGEAHISINLVERHITAGTLVFLAPGTIINPISYNGELEVYGMGLFTDFPMPFPSGQMPSVFNGEVYDFQIQADDNEILTARHIFDTIWHVIHNRDYNRQVVSSLVAALMHHYDQIYRQHADFMQTNLSREQTIFDRFIYLVNQHAANEHQIGFYANKMCLTERYLGTVVRQVSGSSAKRWIDRAIITRIKIELRHTDKSIAQISEEMNFPNPSFFCKYFKRLTNITPISWRTGCITQQEDSQ